jgi:acyl-coenzyme A synthetase/AMP-(fatty) acid ligase
MTHQYIAFHAIDRPDAVAVIDSGRAITYRQFDRDIASAVIALREFGLQRGSAAAIECEEIYFHWLLLLAFERLGVATASPNPKSAGSRASLLAHVDLIVSQRPPTAEPGPRQHAITGAWMESVLGRDRKDERGDEARHEDDRVRIGCTSGTTGATKIVAYSRRVFDGCLNKWIWRCGLSSQCRYLITMPFAVEGAYHHASACIRAGGTVIFENGVDNIGEALARHGITQVTLFPIQLTQVLDRLPLDFAKPPDLTISTLGAAVSPALRARATAQLASRLYETYGCNEVGFICSTGTDDDVHRGAVCPGVQVEVVDEHDRPVGMGQVGRIRVKTDTMADRYIDDPAATERMFKDGWFYPGDLGMLDAPRRLVVVAREDELLNIGGIKIPPTRIEASIAAHAAVADVGVCAMRNADGVEELWIAVSGADARDDRLLQRINDAVRQFPLGSFRVVKLAGIPRTATGKIQRGPLRDAIAANSSGAPRGQTSGHGS